MNNKALEQHLNQLLVTDQYSDYAPNGLQVEGRREIGKVILGVTASLALIDQAIAENADAIVVHHGYFWQGEKQTITGIKQRRIKALLEHDINLYAYHLPLDGHPELGNNAQLGRLWHIADAAAIAPHDLLWTGTIDNVSAGDFADTITQTLKRQPLVIEGGQHRINSIAWCSGAAQGFLERAAAVGVDAYVSGEVSEKTYHEAKEHGIHYFAAGHHATECGGIKAIAGYLASTCDLDTRFIDIVNPV
ncbi:MAG: Nif3-like dinuclear metal center hexameric protein [Gammaproteobacteria bacterium]|nr:MAG: Nif3-like dinuclear metal center hexameric protein [Gammaproteobacteria bacterium]